ncbi:MAG: HIT domain-containing protein [Anaerohalosphaeraceae bacterium]|nr:HIT domain-containing protein [Anaerohalosphaeraceae bacterium]
MQRKNLWAPWRVEYIQGLTEKSECFVCHNFDNPAQDEGNLVLWRTKNCMVIMNRFPYNNGHLLIAPNKHVPDFSEMGDEELLEITKLISQCQKVLSLAISPHGFNVGMNFGRCAGAGLPEHLHIHVVPRWDGDTSFMAVCGQTDVVSQSLGQLYKKLKEIGTEQNLPNV